MIRVGIPSGGKKAKPAKRKGSGLDRLEKQVFRRWRNPTVGIVGKGPVPLSK